MKRMQKVDIGEGIYSVSFMQFIESDSDLENSKYVEKSVYSFVMQTALLLLLSWQY